MHEQCNVSVGRKWGDYFVVTFIVLGIVSVIEINQAFISRTFNWLYLSRTFVWLDLIGCNYPEPLFDWIWLAVTIQSLCLIGFDWLYAYAFPAVALYLPYPKPSSRVGWSVLFIDLLKSLLPICIIGMRYSVNKTKHWL